MSFPLPDTLQPVLAALGAAGGRPFVVGGAVRDWLMQQAAGEASGPPPKDLDVEVYGLQPDQLEAALAGFKVDAVGRSFGVLKVTVARETFDVSLPRRDSKQAPGHRGFLVTPDAQMGFAEGALRRDFTVNAMGWDVQRAELVDPHGGRADLAAGVLRHVSPAFAEDPLRVLRGCQFAARFGMRFDPETLALCRVLAPELHTLPLERLWAEWLKLLLKSRRPSIGLDALVDTGAIRLFAPLESLLGVPQDPQWHPEGQDHPRGSLWVHSGLVLDSAVRVLDDDAVADEEERLLVLLGALCHDLGKPGTTAWADGRWRSIGHEEAGSAPTQALLQSMGCPQRLIPLVVPLVQHHLKPYQLASAGAGAAAIRRLALKVPLERLCRVARADFLGRTTPEALATADSRRIEATTWLLAQAEALQVRTEAPRPLLQGRHLLQRGHPHGPALGRALSQAFEAQLDGAFADLDGALAWARDHLPPP
ncbi:MAG: HD domain-containing protein [Rubrivivax sp.]|nr:HD domain-containing protein [Rubrivivax sp.]